MIWPLGGRRDVPDVTVSHSEAPMRTCFVKGCACTYVSPVMFGGGLSATVPLCPFHLRYFWAESMPPHPEAPCGCLECGHAHHDGRCAAMVSYGSTKFSDAVQCDCGS